MTVRKHTLIASFSSLAATLAFTAAMAGGPGSTPLGDCYDKVISACNQTAHPISCAESGMDGCDDEYGDGVAPDGFNRFQAPTQPDSGGFVLRR